ncbi:uncharacterized protein PV06_06749 [Exophiala oligosperma]|uniref:Uncharacterized protein n=1 Tax=Exophiala oligosperma TaxID=215243 RepID=A0A0D2BUP2_9EURO|nr:uncharacterized protein PV06_06749 [Exophiala oligosperma]KIW41167.1 hypothetical protein PV06_06749 [Exophiala oligosperma]
MSGLILTRASARNSRQGLKLLQAAKRRSFHPEPRSFQNSPHHTHRFVYRWTIQAIGTPLAVAYLCEKVADKSDGESGFKLDLPNIDTGLLTEPIRMKANVWGQL